MKPRDFVQAVDIHMLAARKIADAMVAGVRIVIGASEAVPDGTTLARDGERHIVIKRRATRQEFIDHAPATTPEEWAAVNAMHAPFYYELELWDRVIEREDGERLGIRKPTGRRSRAIPICSGASGRTRGWFWLPGI